MFRGMRKVFWMYLLVAVIGMSASVLHVYPLQRAQKQMQQDRQAAEQRVAAALPLGSTEGEVVAWLRSEGMTVQRRDDSGPEGAELEAQEPYEYASSPPQTGRFVYVFLFGRNGKLSKREVIFRP